MTYYGHHKEIREYRGQSFLNGGRGSELSSTIPVS